MFGFKSKEQKEFEQAQLKETHARILEIAANMKGITDEVIITAQKKIASQPFYEKMTLAEASEQLLNMLFTSEEIKNAADLYNDAQAARQNAKSYLLSMIHAASKNNKVDAIIMERQLIWVQQVEAEQVTCTFLQAALADILNLHFDQKFFPTVEDVGLWVFIEKLLKLKPFPFYEKDFIIQTKLKIICQDAAIKKGDVDAKQFNKAVLDYRMSGLISPLLKQLLPRTTTIEKSKRRK